MFAFFLTFLQLAQARNWRGLFVDVINNHPFQLCRIQFNIMPNGDFSVATYCWGLPSRGYVH